ncbi:MAG: hypothetical protein AAF417_04515 [Pseudomonadota bacterium]
MKHLGRLVVKAMVSGSRHAQDVRSYANDPLTQPTIIKPLSLPALGDG